MLDLIIRQCRSDVTMNAKHLQNIRYVIL